MTGAVHPDESQSLKKAPSNSKTEKILFIAVGLLSVIVATLTVLVIVFATTPPVEDNTCSSEVCIERSLWILKAIDHSVAPCDDFYQYACGRWLSETQLPADKSRTGTFDGINDSVNKMLNKSLSSRKVDINSPNSNAQDKAAFGYQQCIMSDTSNSESATLTFLDQVLDNVGSCSILRPSWTEASFDRTVFMANVQELTRDTFLSIDVWPDLKDSSRNRITVQQPILNLPLKSQILNYTYEPYPTYRQFAINVFTYLASRTNPSLTSVDLIAQIDEMLLLERRIANVTFDPDQIRDESETYSLISLGSMPATIRSLISRLVSQLVTTTVASDELIMLILGRDFLINYEPILRDAQPRALANFGIWSLLRNELLPGLPPRIRNMEIPLYNLLRGSNPPARSTSCLSLFNYYLAFGVGRLYVDEHFDKAIKADLTGQVEYIAEEFLTSSLSKNEWLDTQTRSRAVEKLYAMEHEVAFPDFIVNNTALNSFYNAIVFPSGSNALFLDVLHKATRGTSVRIMNDWVNRVADRKSWHTGPQTVNAFYNPTTNAIYFPGGILYPPFYGRELPKSMNFGGIGYVIGHEISHGFDDMGRKYDKNGNMLEWWTNSSIANFKQRADCMINQYSECCFPDIPKPNCVNGNFTQGENIADNGGLRSSFEAYKKWKKSNTDIKLPGLTNITDEQLFFLTSAHVWCLKQTEQRLVTQLATDPHSPLPYRVNVGMQNLEQFSEVWQCKSGSNMNPVKKCRVW